jgi:hypothetical protein
MAEVREITVSMVDWEVHVVLEGVERELQRLRQITETSDDEDAVADAGNDYLQVAGLKERLLAQARAVFGERFVVS